MSATTITTEQQPKFVSCGCGCNAVARVSPAAYQRLRYLGTVAYERERHRLANQLPESSELGLAVAEVIRGRLVEIGITEQQLAALVGINVAGITASTLEAKMSGQASGFTLAEVLQIAHVLGVAGSELVERAERLLAGSQLG